MKPRARLYYTPHASFAAGHVVALKLEVCALRADLARVLALADTGAANAPSWRVLPLAVVLPFPARPLKAG